MLNSRASARLTTSREWSASDYRRLTRPTDLVSFSIRVKQTDMRVAAEGDLEREAFPLVLEARDQVEKYIVLYPEFLSSLVPLDHDPGAAPAVVAAMLTASRRAEVGPMAAVAGAIADVCPFRQSGALRHLGIDAQVQSM